MSSKQQDSKSQDKSSSGGSGGSGSGSGSSGGSASASSSSASSSGNFARDNSGIIGTMTDKAEQLVVTASSSVTPATAAQISAWAAAWPNIALKDFDTAVKYFGSVTRKDLAQVKKPAHSVGWNCSGTRLAAGCVDTTLRLFAVDHRGVHSEAELKGHTDRIDQLCWSPLHPDTVASTSVDKSVRIWDARSARCAQVVATKGQNINISWSPDGAAIAVGSNKDVVSIVDCKTWRVVKEQKFQSEVNALVWNRSAEYFVVTTGAGTVDVLRYPSFELVHSVDAHTGHVYCVEFDAAGKYLATGGADAFVTLWTLSELACVRTFDRSDSPIRSISFSHSSQFIAAASEDFRIEIYDVESGEHVHTVKTRAETNSLAWNPRCLLLAYATDDKVSTSAGQVSVLGFPSGFNAVDATAAPSPAAAASSSASQSSSGR